MTNPPGAVGADDHGSTNDALIRRWERLAGQPAPLAPAGPVGALANRILVYARPELVPAVLSVVNPTCGGLALAGKTVGRRMKLLDDVDYDGIVLADPAAYEKVAATPAKPFSLPEGRLGGATLGDVLDEQLLAGATAALTPTRFVRAGDTESLKAAAREMKKLNRNDTIFVAPLDISLIDRKFIDQVTAILADIGCPIGLVLGKQFDPLTQSMRVIPNLRNLAACVPLIPLRTDFNAFDLVAHGALAGAIGTGGSVRHAIEPPQKAKVFNNKDQSPSVLFPHLVCWWKGSKIARTFGARQAPRCDCVTCEGQQLSRFVRREQQNEAIRHGVAFWSERAADMLAAPTMRDRAEYWRNVCAGSVNEHAMISVRLRLVKPLTPQTPIAQWATLPAWPVGAPANS